MRSTKLFVAVTLLAILISVSATKAVTISQSVADFTSSPGATTNLTPTSSSLWSIQTQSVSGLYRSPFENFTPAGSQGPGYGNPYASIQLGGSAVFSFSDPKSGLSLLWGSPDTYNTLSFFSGANATGSILFSITGAQLLIQTYGHDQVQFDFGNQLFMSVLLTTGSNAFEFANLQAFRGPAEAPLVATPLPGALPLFVTGLGALGLLGWRRKKKATQ